VPCYDLDFPQAFSWLASRSGLHLAVPWLMVGHFLESGWRGK
jgi:hypothetical protein